MSAEAAGTYAGDIPRDERTETGAAALVPPEGLSAASFGNGATGWWGLMMLVLIESTVFVGLIGSYFYLFANATAWPPTGIEAPDMLLPIIYTPLLLATLIPAWIADRKMIDGNTTVLRWTYSIGAIMLAVFMGLKIYEYATLDYLWDDHAYGSILWAIAGFHSAHVFIILVKVLVMLALAFKGFFHQQRRAAVQGNTLYWSFVVLAWIPLFITVYLFPNYV